MLACPRQQYKTSAKEVQHAHLKQSSAFSKVGTHGSVLDPTGSEQGEVQGKEIDQKLYAPTSDVYQSCMG